MSNFSESDLRRYRAGLDWVEAQPPARAWHRSDLVAAMMAAGSNGEISAGMILTPLSRCGVIDNVDRGYWRWTGKVATPEDLLAYWSNPDGYPSGPRSGSRKAVEVAAPLCSVCGTHHPGEC